jgi:hypothetical protein
MIVATFALVMPLQTVHGAPSKDAGAMTRTVRLELRDGSSKLVELDGVGCDESICSRVAVGARTVGNVVVNRTKFADITAVKNITGETAVFVFKDGTTRQVSVIPDNRMLYVIDSARRTRKIHLGELISIDFDVRAAR